MTNILLLLLVNVTFFVSSIGMKILPSSISHRVKNSLIKHITTISTIGLATSTYIIPKPVHAVGEQDYVEALATAISAKEILKPLKEFIENQGYDNARTNINFILNQLKFQKKIDILVQNSIDYVDDADVIDEAQDAGTKVTNTLREIDSLVYTIIFIPSEDGSVTPTQEKYRKQTYDVCDRLSNELDKLLLLGGNSKEFEKAQVLSQSNLQSYPKVLFTKVTKKSGI